ncbi:MAG: hypothetical protein IKB95_09280 [Bacteroidales bacterium]|nr:hypothetical protein [Bacteroidales bacterium]
MQSKVCNRCPILSRCLLTYGSKACHAAAKEVGFVVKPSLFERLQGMSIEDFAEWLFYNCEFISAEFGSCSGADDSSYILGYLESDGDF